MIDVDALEAFVIAKKEVLVGQEEPMQIDIDSMVVSRKEVKKNKQMRQHMEVEE